MINSRKTRARHPGQRRTVTGLVVSGDRLGVSREYHDRLRAVLHDAAVNGPEAANRSGVSHFRAHLRGSRRVGRVGQRGARSTTPGPARSDQLAGLS